MGLGTPGELAEAIKAGNASKCIVNFFPAGADIFMDGIQVGRPLEPFIIVKKDKPRKIAVKLAGYKPVENRLRRTATSLSWVSCWKKRRTVRWLKPFLPSRMTEWVKPVRPRINNSQ